MGALDHEFCAGYVAWRALYDATGDCAKCSINRNKFALLRDVHTRDFAHNGGGFWPFESQRAPAFGLVAQCDVVHDDVFVHPRDELLANHGVGDAKVMFGKRVRFELCQDVALRIEEQGNDALSWS